MKIKDTEICFITDTHQGARNGSNVFRSLFREYYRDVLFPDLKSRGITRFIHAGDFFDNRNSITLADVDYVVNEFLPLLKEYGITMYVIAGNHDVHYKNTNRINALSLLKTSYNVVVVDNELCVIETTNKNFVLCPWINNENSETLLKELSTYANDDHILVGHFEIVGAKMYANSKVCEHGLEPKELKDFHKVLSGHFHHRNTIGNITYLGALFHYNWQDYGDWRGYTLYDVNQDEYTMVENDYSLFTKLMFHEDNVYEMDDKEFEALCNGQYVVLVITDEYKRVELKEVVHKIEKCSPVSLDILDQTIINQEIEVNENIEVDESKSIEDYVSEYVNSDKDLMQLFLEIKQEAEERVVEFGE